MIRLRVEGKAYGQHLPLIYYGVGAESRKKFHGEILDARI
jgi:hypothetical protein